MNKINMIGFKVGKLTVISESGRISSQVSWLCQCECGNTSIIQGYELRKGNRTSCGKCTNIGQKQKKHGMYQTRIYSIWENMKARCNCPSEKHYMNYGGRGIKVCQSWNEFENFYKWAIQNGYNDNLTIDRIDNDKGYSPDNCRFVSRIVQQNNRRVNKTITYNNETHTIAEWSRIKNIKASTIRARLKYGWKDTEKILSNTNYSKEIKK